MNQRMSTARLIADPVRWEQLLRAEPEAVWLSRGEAMARRLWRAMRNRVPAYRNVLSRHHISLRGIPRDTSRLPVISKATYIRKYPLARMCWDGVLDTERMTIAATSGSTGEPSYFPRTVEQDMQYAALAEMYLRSNFSIHTKSTLYIVGWGMGIWIGGVFSYAAVRIVAERGTYPLSVITPGASREDILKAVQTLGPLYDQVIIGGYPPMIKDLVDEGVRIGIRWRRYHVKFIFSAEGFSEAFREYIAERAGLPDIYMDTLNHYGTVDMGTMAHETPVSILVRRLSRTRPELNMALFGDAHRQPTVAQYVPELFYFEERRGAVLCSAYSGLPLFRYDTGDSGGVHTFADVRNVFHAHGVDLSSEIIKAGIANHIWNLPFVYVFERRDFTVKLSGANIYPEEIRRVLDHGSFADTVTGKCTLEIRVDEAMDQHLVVNVELKKGVRSDQALKRRIRDHIMAELAVHNSEYAYLAAHLSPARVTPRIVLWSYGDAALFSAAGKHRWVRKYP